MYAIKLFHQEKQVLRIVQATLPESLTPFADIAQEVGLSEQEVLELLQRLKEQGFIRRFGATLRHQQAGYSENAMVAWKVEPERIDQVGRLFAQRPEITHCYARKTIPLWPYNLYTMIHARTREECLSLIRELSNLAKIKEYSVLESVEELKKTSMEYF